jgi:serine/threonine protein phosphatase PrpC
VRFLGSEGAAPLAAADLIFAVSDGMGGARAGEFASRIAIDRITKLLPPHFRREGAGESGDLEILTHLFRVIHMELGVIGEAYPECEGMGATLSLCWVTPSRMLIAHVGDSRIYRWREDEGLEMLTEDHTPVAALLRAGKITDYQARTHPARNRLYKALGGGGQYVDPQLLEVDWRKGDRLLLCSDGVTEGIWDRAIGEFLQNGTSADEIVDEAVKVYGRDNATAVVVGVE